MKNTICKKKWVASNIFIKKCIFANCFKKREYDVIVEKILIGI